jgi:hypothetical protein
VPEEPEDEQEEGSEEARKYQCGACYCVWFMPNGIEPEFCPACGVKFDESKTLIQGEDGVYLP